MRKLWMTVASLSLTSNAGAGDAVAAGAELSEVVVTATRTPEPSLELPVAISRVDRAALHDGQLQVNLSESLAAVPGASVESRQNYAQDLQISIRGFGARSSFGVRGIRLYADGIPGTMPDGQGQFSQFDLGSADHIEVLRGPFSALYGNASGGVISVFTEDGLPGNHIETDAAYGSFAAQRYALKDSGETGGVNYVVDAAHFQTDGYRVHSEAERNNFNTKLSYDLGDDGKLTWIGNVVQTPSVQDPLGLTRQQLEADPTQAGVGALQYNTRKWLAQEQTGWIYERALDANDVWTTTLYAGHRATTQYQAIPAATEKAPTNPGGVIDLSRNFWGLDTHVLDRREIFGTPLTTTFGVSYDDLEEARQGHLNFLGSEDGVAGPLRRDEANHVYDLDEYVQSEWQPASRWRLIAGVRNSVVDVSSHDHLPVVDGGPDSGVRYSAANPVAGITYRALPALAAYASYGKGFETPTLNDLAYRSTTGDPPGLNTSLVPARSNHYELGLKAGQAWLRADLDAFYIKTVHELAVLANSSGRSVYQNIGETERRGVEFALSSEWRGGFSARLAYTYLHAIVVQSYQTCVGSPCSVKPVAVGSYLPAVPMNALYADLSWHDEARGITVTLETQGRAHIYADDRNTAEANGYWVENLRVGLTQQHARWRFTEFARIDNLANRSYVGSVIVNESNSRYFEPEPGRTAMLLFTAAWRAQ
jgi:iron complex outermembrane receptor protein